jgi:hypothetical protein
VRNYPDTLFLVAIGTSHLFCEDFQRALDKSVDTAITTRRRVSFSHREVLIHERHFFKDFETFPASWYTKEMSRSFKHSTPTYTSCPPSYVPIRNRRSREFDRSGSFQDLADLNNYACTRKCHGHSSTTASGPSSSTRLHGWRFTRDERRSDTLRGSRSNKLRRGRRSRQSEAGRI